MQFVNQRWFDSPDALLMARGASPNSAIVDPQGGVIGWATNGGIANPVRAELPAGSRLVRFGGIGLPSAAVRGSWWLDWPQYKIVEAFADKRGEPVTLAVRRLCCIPLEWSNLEVVVQVRTKAPLLAYRGAGAPAFFRDKKTNTTEIISGGGSAGAGPVEQLYVPGLGSGDVQHDAIMFEGAGHFAASDSRQGYIITPIS